MCSVEVRLDILRRVPYFAGLPAADMERVNQRFREQGFTPGETITFAGDPATHLYVVAAGKIKLLRHTLAGQDVLLDILTEGEFFGSLALLGDDIYPDSAQAQTPVCTLAISAEDFRAILSAYPSVALAVVDIMATRLRAAHETIRQLSAHSAEQRIAYTLLKLVDKLGEPDEVGLLIQMPLSREDLAAMTGATPETASRILSQLHKDGVIATGRQWIAVSDRDALAAIAEENSF